MTERCSSVDPFLEAYAMSTGFMSNSQGLTIWTPPRPVPMKINPDHVMWSAPEAERATGRCW